MSKQTLRLSLSQEALQSIEPLQNGFSFVLVSKEADSDKIEQKKIFMYHSFEGQVGNLGGIFYRDFDDSKVPSPSKDQFFRVSNVRDVFYGKQEAIFKVDELKDIPTERCFSVRVAEGSSSRLINLIAENGNSRQLFLQGIKTLFAAAPKNPASPRKTPSSPSSPTSASPLPASIPSQELPPAASQPAPASQSQSEPTTQTEPAQNTTGSSEYVAPKYAFRPLFVKEEPTLPVRNLIEGVKLTRFDSNNQSTEEILLWYQPQDGQLGTLYFGPVSDGKTVSEQRALPIVKVGSKRGPAYGEFPEENCFTLETSGIALHVGTSDEQARVTVIQAILDIVIAYMQRGDIFTSVDPSREKDPLRQVLVFYNPNKHSLGALYFSEETNNYIQDETKCMPLSRISDIFLSKKTPELKHEIAARFENSLCFTLATRNNAQVQHLVASHVEVREAFLDCIKKVFSIKTSRMTELKNVPRPERVSEAKTKPAEVQSPVAEQPVSQPASTAATSTSSQSSVSENVMERGAEFVSIYMQDGSYQSKRIFLFFTKEVSSSGSLGALAWCEPGKREVVPNQVLPLKEISDVFLGRQTPELQSTVAADFSSSVCFSLQCKNKELALHLKSDDTQTRDQWMKALRSAFLPSNVTTKTVSKPAASKPQSLALDLSENTMNSNPASPSGSFAVDPISPSSESARAAADAWSQKSSSSLASPRQPTSVLVETVNIQQIQQGHQMVRYAMVNNEVQASQIFVWYDKTSGGKYGAIYWCDAKEVNESKESFAQKKTSLQSKDREILVHRITDVFSGKQTPELQKGASDSPSSHCFALKSKPSSGDLVFLHLSCENEFTKRLWLDAIKDIFTGFGKKVEETKAPTPASPSAAVMKPVDRQDTVASRRRSIALIDQMAVGSKFVGLFGDEKSPTVAPVVVFFDREEGSLGTLYWNSVGEGRQKNEQFSLPLASVTDVFVGRREGVFQTEQAKDFPADCCFSLVAARDKKALNLVASSSSVRQAWLNGIQAVFNKDPGTEVYQTSQNKKVAVSALYRIQQGTTFLNYFPMLTDGGKEEIQSEEVFVWFEPEESKYGCIYWGVPSQRETRIKDQNKRIDLRFVSDVFSGKKTFELQSRAAQQAPSANCLSIVSRNKALHLQAGSEREASFWLNGLKAAYVSKGKKIKEDQENHANDPLYALTQGFHFLSYAGDVNSLTRIEPIFMFFDRREGPQGTFFISLSSNADRVKSKALSLPVHQLSEIFVGKQTGVLKQLASDINETFCFSLVSSKLTLNLQARDRDERDKFLKSLYQLFVTSGKKVSEQPQSELVLRPLPFRVRTTFGVGVVRQPAREDGILEVEFAFGHGFLHRTQVTKIYDVQTTPYGKGQLLNFSASHSPKMDHSNILTIQFPFGIGYVSEDSVDVVNRRVKTSYGVGAVLSAPNEFGIATIKLPFGIAYIHHRNYEDIIPVEEVRQAPKESSSRLAPSSGSVSAPLLRVANLAEMLHFMETGSKFTRVYVDGRAEDVYVWYDPYEDAPLGALLIARGLAKTDKATAEKLPLKQLSDCYLGKDSKVMKALQQSNVASSSSFLPSASQIVQQAAPEYCISLSTKETSFELVALDILTRNSWAEALFKTLQEAGSKVVSPRGEPRSMLNLSSKPEKTEKDEIAELLASLLPFSSCLRTLQEGRFFTTSLKATDGSLFSQRIFFFLDSSSQAVRHAEKDMDLPVSGSFYWTSESFRLKVASRELPLSSLISVSRHSSKSKAVANPKANPECVISLSFKTEGKEESTDLELEAMNRADADLFFKCLFSLTKHSENNIKRIRQAKENERTRQRGQANTSFISEGFEVTYVPSSEPSQHQIGILKYEVSEAFKAGRFCFTPLNSSSSSVSLAVRELSDILVGKLTPELQNPVNKDVISQHCLALCLNDVNNSYSFILSAEADLSIFVSELKSIYTAAQERKEMQKEEIEKMRQEWLIYMTEGRDVTIFHEAGEQAIHLWYEEDGDLGSLFWSLRAGVKEKHPRRVMPLSSVVDLFVGKHAPVFQLGYADEIKDECCFSLVSRQPGPALHIAVPTAQEREFWLNQLYLLFSSKNLQIKPAALANAAAKDLLPLEIPCDPILIIKKLSSGDQQLCFDIKLSQRVIDYFTKGEQFILFSPDAAPAPIAFQYQFPSAAHPFGLFRYKTLQSSGAVDVKSFRDVLLGAHEVTASVFHAEHNRQFMESKGIHENQLFTLKTKTDSFYVAAKDVYTVSLWIYALCRPSIASHIKSKQAAPSTPKQSASASFNLQQIEETKEESKCEAEPCVTQTVDVNDEQQVQKVLDAGDEIDIHVGKHLEEEEKESPSSSSSILSQ